MTIPARLCYCPGARGCECSSEHLHAIKMKLIDRAVSRELIVNVLFSIFVLSLVLVVGNILRKLLPLLVNHDVPVEYLVTFIAYILPFSLIFTIPWGLLTAILLVFGRLSADNELIALRANGVSITRICIPLAAIAFGCLRDLSLAQCLRRAGGPGEIAQHDLRSGNAQPDGTVRYRPGDRPVPRPSARFTSARKKETSSRTSSSSR